MEIIKIKKSDKNDLFELTYEENEILQKYVTHDIYKIVFSRQLFESLFSTYFGKNKFLYGIKIDGRFVAFLFGYIKYAPREKVGYIENLYVLKKFAKRNYDVVLRNAFYKWLKERKIKYCQIDVLQNNPSKNKYQKWGFSADEIRMSKKL